MKTLDAETLWSLPRVGAPTLSPDGKKAVFPCSTLDVEESRMRTNLHLASAGTPPRRLTTTPGKDGAPAWSPDGRRLCFIRREPEATTSQLWVMPLDGGEPERVTDLPVSVGGSPRWHPDGNRILFLAQVPPAAASFDDVKAVLEERKERKLTARVSEDRLFRFWSRWLHEGDFPHLFQVALDSREVTDLTPGMALHLDLMDGFGSFDVSPRGDAVVFSALITPPPYDAPALEAGLFRLELDEKGAKGDPIEFTAGEAGTFQQPIFDPSGTKVAYGWREEPRFYAERVRICVRDLAGGPETRLTEDWDRSPTEWRWTPDGKSLLAVAGDEHRTSLWRLDAEAPTQGTPERLVAGGTVGGVQPTPDGGAVFLLHGLDHPPEVFAVDRDGGEPRALTSLATDALAGVTLGSWREEWFEGARGDRVGMVVVEPPGDAPNPRPLVHLVHGGPHSAFGDGWHWRWNPHVFAGWGYTAAMVNFHGSTGRGAEFTRSIQGEHPIMPFEDVMKGTDHLIAAGGIDESRMAVTGGSYGGYLVTWIAGHTDRFKAIVNHAGVADLLVQMGSDVTQGRLLAYGGEPWDNLEIIERHSPARFSSGMNTPMLVLHGEQDFRVPVGQAYEIYGIHKAKGVPARLVIYPDENHWILKPHNSLHWYDEVRDWLGRWLA